MPKEIDVVTLDTEGLKNLIQNYRVRKLTEAPQYAAALRELERRTGRGLDFDKSFAIIQAAARDGRFVSYKELADASGTNWNSIHYEIGKHLWRLIEYADRMGWPMLSAIVVNKQHVADGAMEPETLKGFIKAAVELGHVVGDEQAFLKEQQEAVFEWGRGEAAKGIE